MSLKNYKNTVNLENRKLESEKILTKYPNKIPVICEPAVGCKLNKLDKCKFLIPEDLTFGQFMYTVRKRINLDKSMAMFLIINDLLPNTSSLMGTLYKEHKEEDNFLYVVYSDENTFG